MSRRRRLAFVLQLTAMLAGGLALAASAWGTESQPAQRRPPARDTAPAHNVILMVSDGCGLEHLTLGRWFKGAPLVLDGIRTGSLEIHVAGSLVGESAAASTAFATGHLTRTKRLGLAPAKPAGANDRVDEMGEMRPFATLVETARLEGLSVGLVVTSSFTHATPAGFFSHVESRDDHETIAAQGLQAGMDVVLGGGWGYLRPLAQGGLREDERDLTPEIEATGCDVVRTAEELSAAQGTCLWGLFAEKDMTPVVDRPRFGAGEPTLAEMTRKAIEVLGRNPRGFFLMVEGSQIDWAGHANDAGYLVREVVAFDEAVEVALDFARRDSHTLLLSVSDHSTGGLTIAGRKERGLGAVDAMLRPLRRMRCAAFRFVDRLAPDPLSASPGEIRGLVREGWGLDISRAEARKIRTAMRRRKPDNRKYAFGEVLSSKYLGLDWTSHDHSGGDVPLHAYGPGRPTGTLAMVDIARLCAGSLGLDLEQATERLFVDVRGAFAPGSVNIRTEAGGGRTALVALTHGAVAELPLDAAHLLLDGTDHRLEGLVFEVAPDGRLYAPRQAIELMRGYRARALER